MDNHEGQQPVGCRLVILFFRIPNGVRQEYRRGARVIAKLGLGYLHDAILKEQTEPDKILA